MRHFEKVNERKIEPQFEAQENEIEIEQSEFDEPDLPKLRSLISEIDIDGEYKSQKSNPLYVSDSEDENENQSSKLRSSALNLVSDLANVTSSVSIDLNASESAFEAHPIENEYCEINYEHTYLKTK